MVHLARAGWLHYRDAFKAGTPLKPGKGPIAVRVRLDDGSGFDLTEAGTQKKLAAYLVRDPALVPGVSRLGPDALSVSREEFEQRLKARRGQVKGVLTEQEVIAGVGNAYSDEILHAAKLSPFAITDRLPTEAHGPALRGDAHGADRRGDPLGRAEGGRRSRGRSAPDWRYTPGPACPARSAVPRSGRSPSPTPACSTAPAARPAGSRWPTAGCPGWSADHGTLRSVTLRVNGDAATLRGSTAVTSTHYCRPVDTARVAGPWHTGGTVVECFPRWDSQCAGRSTTSACATRRPGGRAMRRPAVQHPFRSESIRRAYHPGAGGHTNGDDEPPSHRPPSRPGETMTDTRYGETFEIIPKANGVPRSAWFRTRRRSTWHRAVRRHPDRRRLPGRGARRPDRDAPSSTRPPPASRTAPACSTRSSTRCCRWPG